MEGYQYQHQYERQRRGHQHHHHHHHQYEAVMQHFSHPHTLDLTNLHQPSQAPTTCAGCRLIPSGWTYACVPCNYYLHATCAHMPPVLTHPAHPSHPLTLLPVPSPHPDASFDCRACGGTGTGFSYHCAPCGDLHLHARCASAPPSLTHRDHPHPLALAFSLPAHYLMGFTCDVCGARGASDGWLYRCASCEFDAHMRCATAEATPPQAAQTLAQILSGRRGGGVSNNGDGIYGGGFDADGSHTGGSSDGSPPY